MPSSRAIALVTLLVREYDEAIAFFTEALGFAVLEDSPLGNGKRWVVVAPQEAVGASLLLAKAASAEQLAGVGHQGGGRVFLFLETATFWDDYRRMRSHGVHFTQEPRTEPYGTVVVFQDLYGNKWDLLERNIPPLSVAPTMKAPSRPDSRPVTLRRMTTQDLPMLHDWMNRPHWVEWWGGEAARPTLEAVLTEYQPDALAAASVTPYIALLGEEPIGYAQSYVTLGSGDGWWEDETDPGVRGIDQSLADPAQLSRGLGTRLVRALVELLFDDPCVTKIQTDPVPENGRAIRCYEKAGFVRHGVIATPDGPALYMTQTREAFERSRVRASLASGEGI